MVLHESFRERLDPEYKCHINGEMMPNKAFRMIKVPIVCDYTDHIRIGSLIMNTEHMLFLRVTDKYIPLGREELEDVLYE